MEAPAETTKPESINGGPAAPAAEPAPKRRRGRPFGARTSVPPLGETPVGPESAAPQEAAPRKRRKRAAQVDTEKLKKQIYGVHQLISRGVQHLTGDTQLAQLAAIDDTEAAILAEGYAQVAREYDLELLGGKTGALLQLIGAAAMVYGPRVVMLRHYQAQRAKREPIVVDAEPQHAAAAN